VGNVYIDIFSGCGGLSLGLRKAGWDCFFAIEKNEDAFSTYKHNILSDNSIWPNWLEMKAHDINEVMKVHEEKLLGLKGKIDLIAGGPPCQGFSLAGKRDQNDKRNKLVESYMKFIRMVEPEAVIFENVKGFTCDFENSTCKSGRYSSYVVNSLKRMGFNVGFRIFDMSRFGVPQKRKRFILVGTKKESADYIFDKIESGKSKFTFDRKIPRYPTVKDAIGDILSASGNTESPDSKGFYAGVYGKSDSPYQDYMRDNRKIQCAVDSHRFVNHTKKIIEQHEKLLSENVRNIRITPSDGVVQGLRRRGVTVLDADGISPTITSIPDEILHYCEPRILTVRECARIQSFPDSFEFKGKYTSGGPQRKMEVPRYTQVGNAVPPLFAEQIGLVFMEVFRRD